MMTCPNCGHEIDSSLDALLTELHNSQDLDALLAEINHDLDLDKLLDELYFDMHEILDSIQKLG